MKSMLLMVGLALAAFPALAADDYEVKMKDRTHACPSPDETYKFWSLARHDKEAAAKYSNERKCLMIPAGVTVTVVERDPVRKINGVKLKDNPVIYYVPAADAN